MQIVRDFYLHVDKYFVQLALFEYLTTKLKQILFMRF